MNELIIIIRDKDKTIINEKYELADNAVGKIEKVIRQDLPIK